MSIRYLDLCHYAILLPFCFQCLAAGVFLNYGHRAGLFTVPPWLKLQLGPRSESCAIARCPAGEAGCWVSVEQWSAPPLTLSRREPSAPCAGDRQVALLLLCCCCFVRSRHISHWSGLHKAGCIIRTQVMCLAIIDCHDPNDPLRIFNGRGPLALLDPPRPPARSAELALLVHLGSPKPQR